MRQQREIAIALPLTTEPLGGNALVAIRQYFEASKPDDNRANVDRLLNALKSKA